MFWLFIGFVIIQRLIELIIAKRNEAWVKSLGAVEVGQSHYPYMVMIHGLFFVVMMAEVLAFHRTLSPVWPLLVIFFVITQIGRIWIIFTLGKYWNTKILILPNAKLVKRGLYRYIRHPNYLIVTLEFIIIPCMYQAYFTAILFSLLNVAILSVRIPMEEAALARLTEYDEIFEGKRRLIPVMKKE